MTTLQTNSRALRAEGHLSAGLRKFGKEAALLTRAVFEPGTILAEVEQMRVLLGQANELDAADPARAAMLRKRASRIGLM